MYNKLGFSLGIISFIFIDYYFYKLPLINMYKNDLKELKRDIKDY
jgi:hypothetical protein